MARHANCLLVPCLCRQLGTAAVHGMTQLTNFTRYDPSLSHAAQNLTCSNTACATSIGSATQCSCAGTECYVHTAYNAFEEIAGDLSTNEFTFGSEKVRLTFGTIDASTLTRGSLGGASGIIGLGRGPLSLVSQLSETKFSYCLMPFFSDATNPSHLLVGASAALSGGAPVTSVPFVKNSKEYPFSTYYYLTLAGIMMGKAKLDVPAAVFGLREVKPGRWAGTVVDTGSPFMSLVDVAYRVLKAELEEQLGASLVRLPKVIISKRLELCVSQGDLARLVPPLVLQFGGGGEVVLPPENYWAPVGNETACMVVFSSARKASPPMNETTVIGGYM
uniref:Peptidase A1 domain-containing protein n=1 Tax=Setaria viridis TaxID=4556 RepID=A0A4U6VGX2_SETVI|nr:hypothetical protein SEVIR_3G353400v2 [Setaria viridis]